MTRIDRRERLRVITAAIEQGKVRSQQDVVTLLAKVGFHVTQATASRDLEELGAVRGKGSDGRTRYLIPDRGRGLIDDLTFGVVEAHRILVLTTPPGAAQLIAGRIDRSELAGVVGTIAGDDTIFVACSKNGSLRTIKERLLIIVEGTGSQKRGSSRAK